ncbi:MAG: hypothetical protein LAO30_26375 [Acidobacteriia bacterium]|nr:hypothetical protein [Terriglobia bacterium]
MKHRNQTCALLLGCCLLVCARWSVGQTGLSPDSNRINEFKPEVVPIPAGTHLLMKLISPLHTTSSTPGSGVYLETAFPVVANDRVVIPEHTRVLGTVIDERRPGRVKGRSQLRLRFTQIILPDNRELSIVGDLQSLPGSNKVRTVDQEGTVEPVDQIDADVYTMAKATGVGVLGGAISHHGPAGVGYGALIGGGLGLAKVLFTRGDEISLPAGTKVEMVLQRPLMLKTVSPSPLADPDISATNRPSADKQQNASLPDNKVQCLRDGKTFQCVP